jgi:hypothetical protein
MIMRVQPRRAAAFLGAVATALTVLGAAPAAQAVALPYSDPNAVGGITFCDPSGHPMTHGSIRDKPFVWRAIGAKDGPSTYDAAGRTAILLAYQPRQNVLPGQWSGEGLTASARYTPAGHPIVAATPGDVTLADFISDYPLMWDNLIQVRIYLGAPDAPIYSRQYNAADIKVSGDTWTVLDPASVPCNVGTSTSIETILLPSVAAMPTPTPGVIPSSSASLSGATAPTSSAPLTSAGATSGTAAASASTNATKALPASKSTGPAAWLWAVLAVAVAGLAGTGAVFWRRRTHSPT